MSFSPRPSAHKALPPTPPPDRPLPAVPNGWEAYEASRSCEDEQCSRTQDIVWHCVECATSYCNACWELQSPHRQRRRRTAGASHEKATPLHAERVDSILNPDPAVALRLHAENQYTKWVGLARDVEGQLSLVDYGRYDALWNTIARGAENGTPRFPQLVSFVGETNAGKSALIKLLIASGTESTIEQPGHIAPVTGTAANEMEPTSGDIHLYTDPRTSMSQQPILFVDCEGLKGGERTPLGARTRWASDPSLSDQTFAAYGQVRARPIAWERADQTRSRQDAVQSIYPRLLYAFSDYVVFVLRNPKTIEAALVQLLEWASTALEKSINQPSLPHCVLVLNDVSLATTDREWEVGNATRSLLASMDAVLGEVDGNSKICRLREYWRGIGHNIGSIEDLLRCYYSSFRVLRIPGKPRHERIHSQIVRLRDIIAANCDAPFSNEAASRSGLPAKERSRSLQNALDHYAAHLHRPFNFTCGADSHTASDTRLHILRLLTTLGRRVRAMQDGGQWDLTLSESFRRLIPTLASATVLDCTRRRTGQSVELHRRYHESYSQALGEYLDLHHPCSHRDADSDRRCELVKARHRSQGHQDTNGFYRAGNYESRLNVPTWSDDLQSEIDDSRCQFLVELEQERWSISSAAEEAIAWRMHLHNLGAFFEKLPVMSIRSHATCFSCLVSVSQHPLQCGHVLCTACIKASGTRVGESVHMYSCPLHRRAPTWQVPTVVSLIPSGAGIRVLSLDGGGTRAILQLELLNALRQVLRELGGDLPICSLFDLIVGAGTGALNAALLEGLNEQVDVRDVFGNICRLLYDRRLLGRSLPGLLGKKRRYPSARLISVLKTTFHENTRLFRHKRGHSHGPRVAMACASLDGTTTTVLANYRRPDDADTDELPPYHFERPHEPENEVTIWESVARCMAEQFDSVTIGARSLITGISNTVVQSPASVAKREAELVQSGSQQLDILVSLGTGQSDRFGAARQLRSRLLRGVRRRGISTDELAWENIVQTDRCGAMSKRYIRFNDDFGDIPCAEDDCHEIVRVRKRMCEVLNPTTTIDGESGANIAAQSLRRRLQYLAGRLIATCFYISAEPASRLPDQYRPWTCSVLCRFGPGSREMLSLCRIVQRHRNQTFEPHFTLWPDEACKDYTVKVPLIIENGTIVPSFVSVDARYLGPFASCNLFLRAADGLAPDGLPISGTPRRQPPRILGNLASSRASSGQPSSKRDSRSWSESSDECTDTKAMSAPASQPPARLIAHRETLARQSIALRSVDKHQRRQSLSYTEPRVGGCGHSEAWVSDGSSVETVSYADETMDHLLDFCQEWNC